MPFLILKTPSRSSFLLQHSLPQEQHTLPGSDATHIASLSCGHRRLIHPKLKLHYRSCRPSPHPGCHGTDQPTHLRGHASYPLWAPITHIILTRCCIAHSSSIETLHSAGKLIKTGKQTNPKQLQEVPETEQIHHPPSSPRKDC